MLSAHNAAQQYMNGNEKSKATVIIKKCGILVLIAGLYLI